MTLDTLFLMVISIYLVLIAYGVVGMRKRGLAARARLIASTLVVAIPPIAIGATLLSSGEAKLVADWGAVTLGMLAGGAAVAVLTEIVARRVGA